MKLRCSGDYLAIEAGRFDAVACSACGDLVPGGSVAHVAPGRKLCERCLPDEPKPVGYFARLRERDRSFTRAISQ